MKMVNNMKISTINKCISCRIMQTESGSVSK